ncbi:MAG: dihydrofolate reductase [Pseudozobellia sp.]|nr:dihydrofolate reductase [Pseudozobellia sp.]|tara:strand:+ start:436 stop:984 length:549 start_codon:yes stop_codon:yes gene_type:complete
MRKVIAAINMTLDGFCDHTSAIADEQLHQHFADVLANADIILYGRVTYQLMEYWPTVIKNPTGDFATDEFAKRIDSIKKIVFSRTLKKLDWHSAELAQNSPEEEIAKLKKLSGKNILIGSPSLIVLLTQLKLIDEYQLCVHPIIAGAGLPLFKNISDRVDLKLIKTTAFKSGTVTSHYEPQW